MCQAKWAIFIQLFFMATGISLQQQIVPSDLVSPVPESVVGDAISVVMGCMEQLPKVIGKDTLPYYRDIIRQINDTLQWAVRIELVLNDRVCYDELGCFNKSLSKYLVYLPSNNTETKFFLVTSSNPDKMTKLSYTDRNTIKKSDFASRKCKTVVLVYGYRETLETAQWMRGVRKALFRREKCVNVIIVDWNRFRDLNYLKVAVNAELVGRRLARLIKLLVDSKGAKASDFHLIGFSLGAHIAGLAGNYARETFGLLIGRISALDPAAPGFCFLEVLGPGDRLNKNSAKFVDVIHTNSGRLIKNQMSCEILLGHVDFFPNGGQVQPFCDKNATDENFACNHGMSTVYYIYSINSTDNDCKFKSYPARYNSVFKKYLDGNNFTCTINGSYQCSEMGYNSIKYPDGTGKQYLLTLASSPFVGSQFHFDFTLDQSLPQRIITFLSGVFSSQLMDLFGKPGKSSLVAVTECVDTYSQGEKVAKAVSEIEGIKNLTMTDQSGQIIYFCNSTDEDGASNSVKQVDNINVTPSNRPCGEKEPEKHKSWFRKIFG